MKIESWIPQITHLTPQVYQAGVTKLSKRSDGSPGGSTEREAGGRHAPPAPAEDRSAGKPLEVSALQQRLTELALADAGNIASKQKVNKKVNESKENG